MADVEFKDFSIQVQNVMDDTVNAILEECAGEIESQTKRNTRVDTGQTKNNWRHYVDDAKHEATIGNSLENAIWEEFGTGEFALNGDGRKGGWSFKDKEGNWVFTLGKTPSRAFHKAFESLKNKIIKRIQEALKGM